MVDETDTRALADLGDGLLPKSDVPMSPVVRLCFNSSHTDQSRDRRDGPTRDSDGADREEVAAAVSTVTKTTNSRSLAIARQIKHAMHVYCAERRDCALIATQSVFDGRTVFPQRLRALLARSDAATANER